MVNPVYGKTINKPVETDTIVKDNRDDFEKYISYNYSYIGSVIEVSGQFCIKKVKPILSHFNYVHCGVEILNMSRRIMNKVFSCAGDCDIKVYYQDTASIHLNYENVAKIGNRHTDKWVRVGGWRARKFPYRLLNGYANSEIYAIQSLFLGKKTYINILEPTDKDGKTINSEHIRMKGIPTPCIKYYAE